MCGIHAVFQTVNCNCDILDDVDLLLTNRGPDGQNKIQIEFNGLNLSFKSTLLWLRGKEPYIQPDMNNGNILLWNGDLFYTKIPNDLSDTEYLSQLLRHAVKPEDVLKVLADCKGPAAFVYFNPTLRKIWFGRDFFGRHSLLAQFQPCHIVLSSVRISKLDLVEVPALGIYQIGAETGLDVDLIPWSNRMEPNLKQLPSGISISSSAPIHPSFCPTTSTHDPPAAPYTCIEEYLQNYSNSVDDLKRILSKSVEERMRAQPLYCRDCVKRVLETKEPVCTHSKIAVLFSGGLDSVVLAFLASQYVADGDTLDLINVAFQQNDGTFLVPDRLTGLQAIEEMQPLLKAKLNLVLVNVSKSELQEMREARIKDLLYPLDTVLDDSIGCAIWFASRGRGVLWQDQRDYQSPARVLLLGMGADEQLGGYSRHKAAFSRSANFEAGRQNLLIELQRQLDGISERNLGRDNRIVSDHGLAGRYPYLDEMVVEYIAGLPLEAKMNLALARGTGDKMILRALAFSLGLHKTAQEPKRAIQFGSRIAKLENRKEKGTDKAMRL